MIDLFLCWIIGVIVEFTAPFRSKAWILNGRINLILLKELNVTERSQAFSDGRFYIERIKNKDFPAWLNNVRSGWKEIYYNRNL